MNPGPTVFVVDDDPWIRNCIRRLAETVILPVEEFSSAEEFLATHTSDRQGCVVLDVRMPGMSGLDLQNKLTELGYRIPIILMSGFGDVSVAVRAMKAGAVSFLEKPFNEQLLLDTIQEAMRKDAQIRQELARESEVQSRLALLTPREREVLDLLVVGNINKQVAARLQISEKTVEIHRAHVMKKLQAETIAELVRLAYEAGAAK